MQLRALLLDLDGTLVDTAPDMVGTLNRLLVRHGHPMVDINSASKVVSNGAKALIEFGFGDAAENFSLEALIDEFLEDYANHTADLSHPYSGMLEVLNKCLEHNLRWGVVTNKPLELSRSLLDQLGLMDDCSILLGGDSLPVRKPDPAPLLHSSMLLNLAPSECLYVGDHHRDIIAGNDAGMDTAVALWGYIDNHHQPEKWGATYLLKQPSSLLQLIEDKINQTTKK